MPLLRRLRLRVRTRRPKQAQPQIIDYERFNPRRDPVRSPSALKAKFTAQASVSAALEEIDDSSGEEPDG
jgi:hypothetical protein